MKEALGFLRQGDTLVVVRLDRAARSLSHLLSLLNDLYERRIHFHSINENIDTTSAGGYLVFNIYRSIAEYERELIRGRTQAGSAAARKRGCVGGRPKAMTDEKLQVAMRLLDAGTAVKDVVRCNRCIGIGQPSRFELVNNLTS